MVFALKKNEEKSMRGLSSVSRLEFGVLSSAIAAIIILMAAWRSSTAVFANRHNGEAAAVNQATPVTTVSAASFAPIVAPDSIAASFGGRLATQVAQATSDPLPTSLAGTTVKVNGVMAGLFYVSPTQVNYHIPPETKPGAVSVVITSGDGVVSMGAMRVEAVAPGVFTADGSGQGTPAAVILRALPNGDQRTEPITIPIDLGPPGERVFLILFLTGVRGAVDGDGDGNLNETAHVLLGGSEITPAYAGKAPSFVGLDQVNVELPRSLIGRGAVDLRVNYSAITQSNMVRIEIGGPPPSIRVTGFDPATALVGDEVTINGANFAANANDNQVYFVDEDLKNFQARVTTANQTQIKAIIPFGAGSGPTLVRMPQSEVLRAARLTLRTSISGFVETTEKQPIPGMTARVREPNISARAGGEGKFILPDVPPGLVREVEIDSSSSPLPFPKYATTLRVLAGRGDHLDGITIGRIDGPS